MKEVLPSATGVAAGERDAGEECSCDTDESTDSLGFRQERRRLYSEIHPRF